MIANLIPNHSAISRVSPAFNPQRLRNNWNLESLQKDPEFIALVDELEADILRQRQWYEENKDKPLSEISL